ncbi:MAG: BRCT domain-containing protein [Planctomycetota bacterium]
MASRQSGVHLSYLIVTVVICLGLVVWGVMQHSEQQKLTVELAQLKANADAAKKTNQDQAKEIKELREVIGNEGKVPVKDVKDIITAGALQAAKLSSGGKVASQYTSLTALISDLTSVAETFEKEKNTQIAEAQASAVRYDGVIKEKTELENAKNEEIAELRQKQNELLEKTESIKKEARDAQDELRAQIEKLTADNTDQVAALKNTQWLQENRLLQKDQRIEFLQNEINREKNFDQVVPDGRIVDVVTEQGYAWIDIGIEDRLRRGVYFDVFNYVKGGKKLRKGRVEVMKVEDKLAQVRVLDVYDSLNPINKGDYISSPFYDKGIEPVFVIAGDQLADKRLSIEELTRRITQFGGKVEDKVHVKTSYLVTVSGYETTEAYKEARGLGVTVLREAELLDFIGY